MSSDNDNADLLELVKDAREHLIFFKELGVEGLEKTSSAAAVKTAPETERLTPQRKPGVTAAIETPLTTTPSADSLFGDLGATPARIPRSSETFEEIWSDIGDCTRCPLYQGRKNIVQTDGNRKARLMFVGEAPGADEDIQAKPFVGRAGQLLTKIIEAIGLKREEVLIGNVNRCRPPANRPPTPEEATMCKPFLLREIAAVQPEVIVVLGNTAMRNLLELKQGITKVRGQFQDYQGVKVMPTFHPAYLLRDPSKKKETWEDLKKVRDYLDSTRKQES
jgi:uracil-DNA glycosylase family 4